MRATVQTDILVNGAITNLRLANGLALSGTMTFSGNGSSLLIEGTQTISSGTIVSTTLMTVQPVGTSTLTLGQDVTFKAQVVFQNSFTNFAHKLSLINRGTITTPGIARGDGAFTRTESFTNFGVMTNQPGGQFSIEDKTFLNAATGRITISEAAFLNLFQARFGSNSTTSVTNAGTIELHNTTAQFMTRTDGVGQTWSNTGNILVDKSVLGLYGTFTSDSLTNVQNTGLIGINGVMDNVGRSFTFTTGLGLIGLGFGRIKGGTLNMSGPGARLEFAGTSGGTLDGVTINGDIALGPPLATFQNPNPSMFSAQVTVQNGLTLNGTFTLYNNSDFAGTTELVTFSGGPQTVSGNGTIQFLPFPVGGGSANSGLKTASGAGVVTIAPTITLRGGTTGLSIAAGLGGNFISSANVVIDANQGISLGGIRFLDPTAGRPFVNRVTITVPATRKLFMNGPFTNEGTITVSGSGFAQANLDDSWKNSGTIDLTGGGTLYFDHIIFCVRPEDDQNGRLLEISATPADSFSSLATCSSTTRTPHSQSTALPPLKPTGRSSVQRSSAAR